MHNGPFQGVTLFYILYFVCKQHVAVVASRGTANFDYFIYYAVLYQLCIIF